MVEVAEALRRRSEPAVRGRVRGRVLMSACQGWRLGVQPSDGSLESMERRGVGEKTLTVVLGRQRECPRIDPMAPHGP